MNCGIEIQGASSQVFSPKHGFQLSFKSKYGAKKLKSRIFPQSSVKTFDSLVLRNPTHDSWVAADSQLRKNARYINDAWAAETQRHMGHLSPQHRWVHLFLNGFYWGVYAIVERPDEHFASSHIGGRDDDYDVFNSNRLRSGSRMNRDHLTKLVSGAGIETQEVYLEVEQLLDIEAFIDYVLYNLYANNIDWVDKNYWLIGRRSKNAQFQFVNWDAEILFWEKLKGPRNPENKTSLLYEPLKDRKFYNDTQAVGFFLNQLSKNPVFRRHFGDRVHFHMKEGGILSPKKSEERYRGLLKKAESFLDAEAARWGDSYGQEAHGMDTLEWEDLTSKKSWLFSEFFPKRTEILRGQLQKSELYPKFEAPILTLKKTSDGKLFMTAKNPNQGGEIYFSKTGQDPASPNVPNNIERFSGKDVLVSERLQICARILLDKKWSALETLTITPN